MTTVTDTAKRPASELLNIDAQTRDLCITDENLDKVWPRDPGQMPTHQFDWPEKLGTAPPECGTIFFFDEHYGRDAAIGFLADGDSIEMATAPLPPAGALLCAALIGAAALTKLNRKRK